MNFQEFCQMLAMSGIDFTELEGRTLDEMYQNLKERLMEGN